VTFHFIGRGRHRAATRVLSRVLWLCNIRNGDDDHIEFHIDARSSVYVISTKFLVLIADSFAAANIGVLFGRLLVDGVIMSGRGEPIPIGW
jgi:hypothetical protein